MKTATAPGKVADKTWSRFVVTFCTCCPSGASSSTTTIPRLVREGWVSTR